MKIAIASGKGGTGKTTIATNLVSLIAEERELFLADLDVEEPNSGLFIKGDIINEETQYKFVPHWDKTKCLDCGKCQKVCFFNSIIHFPGNVMVFPKLCHSCYACAELCPGNALEMKPEKIGKLKHLTTGKLQFVESRLDIGQEMAVPLISQTIKYLRQINKESKLEIYDAPPGTSCPVIEAVKNVDLVLLVTEPTPFGLNDLKLAVETVRQLKKKFYVIINRDGIGDDKVEKYCNEEGIQIAAKIKNNRKIAESYSRGNLLYKLFPEVKEELQKIYNIIKMEETK